MWFFGGHAGPWRLWGVWWKRRVFLGVSVIRQNEDWELSTEFAGEGAQCEPTEAD